MKSARPNNCFQPDDVPSARGALMEAVESPNIYTMTWAVIGMLRGSTVDTIQERYSRQVLYPGIGEQGQRRLAAGHVAVVGCGATGAAAAALLARAGGGTLTLIDRDFVEESNLQRQVLFDEADAREALPKAEAARQKIAAFNSQVQVHAHVVDLVPSNIRALLHEAAIILDATDNFETRY